MKDIYFFWFYKFFFFFFFLLLLQFVQFLSQNNKSRLKTKVIQISKDRSVLLMTNCDIFYGKCYWIPPLKVKYALPTQTRLTSCIADVLQALRLNWNRSQLGRQNKMNNKCDGDWYETSTCRRGDCKVDKQCTDSIQPKKKNTEWKKQKQKPTISKTVHRK